MAMASILLLMAKRILIGLNLTLHICRGLRRQEGCGLFVSMLARVVWLVRGIRVSSLGGNRIRRWRNRARLAKFLVVLGR